MTSRVSHLEQEAKFWVPFLRAFREHVERRGGELLAPRRHEYNLRFDTPQADLARDHRVLRLRRDRKVTLTYKGPARNEDGVLVRLEIEVELADFDQARRLLEALGYRVALAYEKYRTLYRVGETVLALDELPMGTFVEIEGASPAQVRQAARHLGLDVSAAVPFSYAALFHRLQEALGLPVAHLTFEAFRDLPLVDLRLLGLRPAWRPPVLESSSEGLLAP